MEGFSQKPQPQNQKASGIPNQLLKMNKSDDNDSGAAMDSSLWNRLPPEMIDNVLSRLPLKSLCRFKSVSSSWNTLISSPQFTQTHIHITNTTNKPQKTLLITPSSNALYSVDLAEQNPTAKKLAFPISSSKDNSTYECISVLGSCNGLVLISDQDDSIFLFNPFTGENKKLPESPYADESSEDGDQYLLRGLGYDSSTDDYKVLMLLYREFRVEEGRSRTADVAVYSLRANCWRIIQVRHYDYPDLLDGFYFNERLHWLCFEPYIVAFDLSREVFREIRLPASYDDFEYYDEFEGHHMEAIGGCLCLIFRPDGSNRKTGVWMMNKYGVRDSWTKFTVANPGMSVRRALILSSEGELVLKSYGKIGGVDGELLDKYKVGGNYVETLVSPNHGWQIRRYREASLGGENSKSYQLTGKEHPDSSPEN